MKKNKLSQSDIAILHLIDNKGIWIPSYKLIKVQTKKGWLGTAVTRRMREISARGTYIINDTKYYIERQERAGFAEYRATGMKKNIERVEIIENEDGTRIAKLIKETINI